MRLVPAALVATAVTLISPLTVRAQSSEPSPAVAVPRLINVSGVFTPADGQPPTAVEAVTLAIYTEPEGGTPLWQETQSVAIDAAGRYAVLLGATHVGGIPAEVFASGEAQWLGMVFARGGEVEGPRVRITSVPYALRSADADTLGGRPASAYLLAPEGPAATGEAAAAGETSDPVAPAAVNPGTTNFLAKYVNGTDVGNSAVYETGGSVGIGTTSPLDTMHVRFTNTNGGFTGYAVQNLGNTASSFSGTLFYDQNGALGQFQGFNNVTHEYRINNIATGGSINFMTGSVSRFSVANDGRIGIGTTNPAAAFELARSGGADAYLTAYSGSAAVNPFVSPTFQGRSARGTAGAPTAVQNNDILATFTGGGYGATSFGTSRAAITMRANQNWTDSAQGTSIRFSTTPNGNTTPGEVMIISSSGTVGIGTGPNPFGTLEIVRNSNSTFTATAAGGAPQFLGRASRGTAAAPTAVQSGDTLASFSGGGFGTTAYALSKASINLLAVENWTDSAQGAFIVFNTTPIGSTTPAQAMQISPAGSVGIGTLTVADKLQVVGDIRVGTSGNNGCLKDFSGTGIVGTCASDLRFKKDITPFGSVLGSLTRLQPVSYSWRTDEFPQHHFGPVRASGLIAQEVEAVFPELVVTGADGYKAVNYSTLPLLTIQAVKELKSENDALRAENDVLKAQSVAFDRRLAELERLMAERLAVAGRR